MAQIDIDATKRKADALIASYGRLTIIGKYDAALEHLSEIWDLTPLELQILRPKNAGFTSLALRKTGSAIRKSASYSSKSASAVKFTEFAAQAKKAKTVTDAASIAKGHIADIGALAKKGSQIGIGFAKKNPLVLAATGVGSAVISLGVGSSMLKSLRSLNEECYKLRSSDSSVPET
jgi:hypothetical protein